MNVLVIGGAGYIGSHVVREFLDAGHSVVVYDNLSSGLRQNLFAEAAFVQGDILDYPALLSAVKAGSRGGPETSGPFDVAVHLAAFKAAGESMLAPEKYSLNNISGTVNIINALCEGTYAKAQIPRIVFSSSAAVYGEPQYLPVDEKHPTEPENYYGFTKLEIERILAWYDRLKGLRFAALRYFNAAGYDPDGRVSGLEQNPANLIPVVMETASGKRARLQIFGNDYDTPDGTCIRDYVHVSDLARAHVAAAEYLAREDKSLTVNLGSGKGISVLEAVEAARRVTGRPVPADIVARRPGDPAKLWAASALARETLGWDARLSDIETIVRSTWTAYTVRR